MNQPLSAEDRATLEHRQPFNSSEKTTLGVEWELALIDPETRDLVPRAQEMVDYMGEHYPHIQVEREFLQNTVELVTGVCDSVSEIITELRTGLKALREAADTMGVRLWTAGSHPFAHGEDQPVSNKGAYTEIVERTQYWGRQMLIWGVHVHVGMRDEDRVWPIINAVMTTFPQLLALSASSPGWKSVDTGYASNRTMLYQQLPTAGMPYVFQNWDEWSEFMEDQNTSGVINHTGSMHLDIRPSSKWGTIEVRVCDSPTNLEELSALVALTHCLVVYFDRCYDRGEPLPSLQQWHSSENKWRAARYGMEAEVITTRNTEEELVTDSLVRIVRVLTPLAHELGCADELSIVSTMLQRPAAYQRQRALYQKTGSWKDVVDQASAELYAGSPKIEA